MARKVIPQWVQSRLKQIAIEQQRHLVRRPYSHEVRAEFASQQDVQQGDMVSERYIRNILRDMQWPRTSDIDSPRIMEPFVKLALERWAEDYNEKFGLRDAKRIMRRRRFMETVDNWLTKANKQDELNMLRWLLSDFDRDLQWLPHSHNPDRTLSIRINFAIAVELSGEKHRKHTGTTREAVNRLKDRIPPCPTCDRSNKERGGE